MSAMRRWLSLSMMLLMLVGVAAPLLACVTPDGAAASQPCECCRHMGGMNHSSASTSCCKVGKQSPAFPAAVTERQTVPSPQIASVLFTSATIQVCAFLRATADNSVAMLSPPPASVLRI